MASVVISSGDLQSFGGLEIGEVVDVTVQHGDHVRCSPPSLSSELSGWAFGCEISPTLAQRVWPSTTARPVSTSSASQRSVSAKICGAKFARVVAQLADLGRCLVDEADTTVGDPDGAGTEQRVGGALGEHRLHGR